MHSGDVQRRAWDLCTPRPQAGITSGHRTNTTPPLPRARGFFMFWGWCIIGAMSEFPEYKQAQVSELIPYARNSRTHSDEQVNKIASSIKEFGFLNPVITDGDNGIVAGHGRVMAAQRIGMEYVPTVEANHLTDAQKRAYVIADNRLALDAGWDDEMLRVEFADLEADGFDLELTGFTLDEIGALEPEPEPEFDPGDEPGEAPESSSKEVDPDDFQLGHQCPKCGFEFDD